ncbi:MAG: hypothetical protein ACK5WP_09655 [Neisseriaceae bacterium]
MIKKYLILLLPVLSGYTLDYSWTDFDNNVYIGGAYSNNNASVNQFGAISTSSGALNLGLSMLFPAQVYFNIEGDTNFTSGGSFVANWYNVGAKLGYAFPVNAFNFIPYLSLGIGNEGAYYTSSANINYGIGLLSELAIDKSWQVYADINYQLQSLSGQAPSDFNNNVINNYASYSLSGSPYTYGITLGAKYITSKGFFISPYVKYQNYNQSFTSNGGSINFGTINPQSSLYQAGIKIGLVL